MRIYDIGTQFQELYNLVDEVETNEDGTILDNSETLAELFNDLEVELSEKLDNTNYIIKELAVSEQALKDEAKRLTSKAKALSNRQAYLKELIKNSIIASGQASIKSKFSFNVKTIKSLNYDDVNMFGLDDEFIRTKQELDKTKLKEYIKAGGVVEGVKEVENTSLTIR